MNAQWLSEKKLLDNYQNIHEQLDKAKLDLDCASRDADLTKMSELQYGKIPELEEQLAKASLLQRNQFITP